MCNDIVKWVRATFSRRVKLDFWTPAEAVGGHTRRAVQAHDSHDSIGTVTTDNHADMPAHITFCQSQIQMSDYQPNRNVVSVVGLSLFQRRRIAV
jgi:hypothetical protein